jgi:hypothetical protein
VEGMEVEVELELEVVKEESPSATEDDILDKI